MNWLQNVLFVTISFFLARMIIDSGSHQSLISALFYRKEVSSHSLMGTVLGVSYGLSMFFSNTIVVLCMIPLIKTVVSGLKNDSQKRVLSTHLILALIYGANIGGMASPIGSPQNLTALIFIEVSRFDGSGSIGFFSWLLLGIPSTLVLLLIGRQILRFGVRPVSLTTIFPVPPTPEERRYYRPYLLFFLANIVFILVLAGFQFVLKPPAVFHGLNPVDLVLIGYSLAFMYLVFIHPRGSAGRGGRRRNGLFLLLIVLFSPVLLVCQGSKEILKRFNIPAPRWITATQSLLQHFFSRVWRIFFNEQAPGLAERRDSCFVSLNRLIYELPFFGLFFMALVILVIFILLKIGDNPATPEIDGIILQVFERLFMSSVAGLHQLLVFMVILSLTSIFLTEIVNNMSVQVVLFPLMAHLRDLPGINPVYFILAVTIASSGAFMTPVATPVNAIAFASIRAISLKTMVRKGFFLNLLGGLWIALVFYVMNRFF